ncbi:MAG: NERD domain-containing protein [Anaerosomatales bacterium]|nr:NERD domain-containing protein [Anaerosomatales bacterium]
MPPTVIGVAGNSARWRGWVDRAGLPLFTAITLLIALRYLPVVTGASTPGRWFAYFLAVAIGLGINFKGLREFITDYQGSKMWLKGAEGELLTGTELEKLPASYVVIHDFNPVGPDGKPAAWNVDHIVIGPTGVFIVETKNYSGKRVRPSAADSTTRANVKQVQRVAAEFKRSLIVWSGGQLSDLFVVPLLVYTQPGAYVERTQEKQVKVIPLKWLASDITSWKGRALDPDQVYRIARVLFSQLRADLKNDYAAAFDSFGQHSKRFRQERASARTSVTDSATRAVPTECPKCGGKLIRRTVKQGPRIGRPLLGCENFAKHGCRFVFNLQE